MKATIRILVLIAVLPVIACDSKQAAKSAPDQVTVQMKWVHQSPYAGFYLAEREGYYAAENIAVTFVEGGPGIRNVDRVVTGQAEFGVDTPEAILVKRSQGEPAVAIAVLFRQNPTVFLSMAGSGIERPGDFLNKTAAVVGSDSELLFKALMKKLGFDLDRIKMVPYSYEYQPFYNGEVDVTSGYYNGGVIRIRQKGYQVNLIWPSDYGIHTYSDTLFTTEQMVQANPDLTTRFLRATLRGWRKAVEDPQRAVEATMIYAHEADRELQARMMEASIPLIHTGEDQIGMMKETVWEEMERMLIEQAILPDPVDLKKVCNLRFLEKVYGRKP